MTDIPSRLPLEQLAVARFRGLRDVQLRNLERINFLVGSGNSGKTSVLEAIACYCSPLDVREWLRIVRLREMRENRFYALQWVDVLRWLFPHEVSPKGEDRHGDIRIAAEGHWGVSELVGRCTPHLGPRPIKDLGAFPFGEDGLADLGSASVHAEDEEDGWRFRLDACLKADGRQHLEFVGWAQDPAALPESTGPHLTCQLLAPYAHRNQTAQLKDLTRTTVEDEKADVVELLRDLDPMIVGIEILADASGNRAMVALRHKTSGVAPIQVFGDGIRRALMIALAIRQCSGGLLLLDEIEAALHVSAMGKVFPWLERACTRFNVQLFGTTHSLEAIDAVAGCIDSRSVAAFHVTGPTGEAKRYSRDMLKRLVHERGLDIR